MPAQPIESEKVLERKLCAQTKDKGGLAIKMISALMSGLPDRLLLFPGARLFFVEMKTTGKKPTKLQLLIHRRLEALGFPVTVIDSTEGINEFFNKHF